MQNMDVVPECKVLNITSSAFKEGGRIPIRYTCEGANVNPPLAISDPPPGARSLVLMVEDPDAPNGTWLHWLVWNIPVTHHINEDEIPGDQGINDFGLKIYGGPCPPSGRHRYCFKVYALDNLLDLKEGSTQSQVEEEMRNHIVAYGKLVGWYRKLHPISSAQL